MRLRLFALLSALLVTLGISIAPVQASTGGTPDGDTHPNVGLILFYTPSGRFRCSATLISPTVLVTAAHCTDGVVGSTLVTFDSVIAEQPPSPFPVAADPAAGYTDAEITAAGYLSGTSYTHPDYSDFTDTANWYDVGVVVLDQPVTGIDAGHARRAGTARPHRGLGAAQDPLHRRRLRHRGAQAGRGPAEAHADDLPADPSLRRDARPEADPADPADQRQRQGQRRHRWHLLR